MSRYQFQSGEHAYIDHVRDILTSDPGQPPSQPTRLLPHVFLGSQFQAESLRLLRKLGITHVLNCAGFKGPRPEPDVSPYEEFGIDYYEFRADDHDFYDITRHFNESFNYLDKVKKANGTALVHCALGVNRSAAVCAAYMMVHSKICLLEVIKTLKKKRRLVLSNPGFQRQLVCFARSIGLLGVLPMVIKEDPVKVLPWHERNGPSLATYRRELERDGLYKSRMLEPDIRSERISRCNLDPSPSREYGYSSSSSSSRYSTRCDDIKPGASGAYDSYRRYIMRGNNDD